MPLRDEWVYQPEAELVRNAALAKARPLREEAAQRQARIDEMYGVLNAKRITAENVMHQSQEDIDLFNRVKFQEEVNQKVIGLATELEDRARALQYAKGTVNVHADDLRFFGLL